MTAVLFLIIVALAAGGAWAARLAVIPYKPCKTCGGRGHCRRCNFKGKVPRFGARAVSRAIGKPLD